LKIYTSEISYGSTVHFAFNGEHNWPEITASKQTLRVDFDRAIDYLCRYAAVLETATLDSHPDRFMNKYFSSRSFSQMCDVLNSARLVRHTKVTYRTSKTSELLLFLKNFPVENPVGDFCKLVEADFMEQHLEYIWRHPEEFPRDEIFHAELYLRSFRTAFEMFDEEPCSLDELKQELDACAQQFEALKRDRSTALAVWTQYAWNPKLGISRSEEKSIKKALKRNEWPEQMFQSFEWKAAEMRLKLRHIVLWAQRTNTPGINMPTLTGSAPKF